MFCDFPSMSRSLHESGRSLYCKDKESACGGIGINYSNSKQLLPTENVPYDTAASIIPARRDRSSQRSVCGGSDDMTKVRVAHRQARRYQREGRNRSG
jgi:guanyl-specific ribonuclease Sa